jgi:hypothetical protein
MSFQIRPFLSLNTKIFLKNFSKFAKEILIMCDVFIIFLFKRSFCCFLFFVRDYFLKK